MAEAAAAAEPAAAPAQDASVAPDLLGLADVGAVWAPTRSQSEVDQAERAAQDGVVAATESTRDARETLLCAPLPAATGHALSSSAHAH